jgi:hypothetical protein
MEIIARNKRGSVHCLEMGRFSRDVNSARPNRSRLCCICWDLNEIYTVDVSATTTAVRHLVREHLIDTERKSVDEVPPTLRATPNYREVITIKH